MDTKPAESKNTPSVSTNEPPHARDFKSDISLMQTVYGILLTLGFRLLGDALFKTYRSPGNDYRVPICVIASCFTLALIGFRFFWAVGNIRRYMVRHENETNSRHGNQATWELKPPYHAGRLWSVGHRRQLAIRLGRAG